MKVKRFAVMSSWIILGLIKIKRSTGIQLLSSDCLTNISWPPLQGLGKVKFEKQDIFKIDKTNFHCCYFDTWLNDLFSFSVAGLLFSYDPPVEVGRDGRPRKHYIITHSQNFHHMFNTLLHEVGPIMVSQHYTKSYIVPYYVF